MAAYRRKYATYARHRLTRSYRDRQQLLATAKCRRRPVVRDDRRPRTRRNDQSADSPGPRVGWIALYGKRRQTGRFRPYRGTDRQPGSGGSRPRLHLRVEAHLRITKQDGECSLHSPGSRSVTSRPGNASAAGDTEPEPRTLGKRRGEPEPGSDINADDCTDTDAGGVIFDARMNRCAFA